VSAFVRVTALAGVPAVPIRLSVVSLGTMLAYISVTGWAEMILSAETQALATGIPYDDDP